MIRAERVARRAARLHAIEDAVITMIFYAGTWAIFMAIITKMMRIM